MAYADNFDVFGPYKKKDTGRSLVVVIDRNGKRRSVSLPKWIMEQHLGRELNPETETVDHLDFNFNNNDINNLRVVPRAEHSADDTRRVKLIKLKCAWCDCDFERSPRLLRDKAKKGKAGPFCSKKCAGKYARKLQLKLIDKLGPQSHVESEYYRRKLVNASDFTFDFVQYLIDHLI